MKVQAMETRHPIPPEPGTLFDPFGSWEAAAHWNALAWDLMAHVWQHWAETLTSLQPLSTLEDLPPFGGGSKRRPGV